MGQLFWDNILLQMAQLFWDGGSTIFSGYSSIVICDFLIKSS